MASRVVVLDPTESELAPLVEHLRRAAGGDAVLRVVSDAEGLDELLTTWEPELVVIDLALGDGEHDGLEVLERLRASDEELPIVVAASRGDVDVAKKAVAAGATDFLVRGDRLGDRVSTQLAKVRRVLRLIDDKRALARENLVHRDAAAERYRIVTRSPAMLDVVRAAERVAKVPRPVLVLGERGTGKELLAHAIHAASGVRGPFVAINCAAFAEPLLESELFGHERGAYTGADRRVPGKFELASEGTLFLDEIGNTTLAFQRKILRAVEYGTFVRVGGHVELRSRARIVAATNTDLAHAMREGAFLADLYDRLAFEILRIPPLRDRPDDVELLAHHFLDRFVAEVPALGARRLSSRALEALRAHAFPGNVRELKNVIERAVYRDGPDEIGPEHLGELHPRSDAGGTFHERIERLERELIADALRRADHVQADAAKLLGLTYDQLRHYVRKHRR
ncbi:sigma-54-dependent transcriptional regulator [Sandaracinus amylolyticus]|uniref:sigma-54-dependent transcriptional regulator n=1 Tax=Sandaracinus amylolyticus TaxID=927083 RepID=UPI001F2BA7BB|nr:sigma-54 dependent transcriptional regulator [Sandaracinus amylolyticus]UJR83119.1 Hypothetical protein I5071_51850 [Sandaracinus amylolyticus]